MVGRSQVSNNITVIHLTGNSSPKSLTAKPIIIKDCDSESVLLKDKDYCCHYLDDTFTKNENTYEKLQYFYSSSCNRENISDPYLRNEFSNFGTKHSGLSTKHSELDDRVDLIKDEEDYGPYSLVSIHESVVESSYSCHHHTTITIGKRTTQNTVRCSEDNDFSKNVEKTSQKTILNLNWSSSGSQTEIVRPPMQNKQLQVSMDDKEFQELRSTTHNSKPHHAPNTVQVSINFMTSDKEEADRNETLDLSMGKERDKIYAFPHYIYPNRISHLIQDTDSDRISSCDSFSSAYTVTEYEIAASETSAYGCTNRGDETSNNDQIPVLCGREDLTLKERSDTPCCSNKFVLDNYKYLNYKNKEQLFKPSNQERVRVSSEDEIITIDDSCVIFRDQRDKNEDEIWVANVAKRSCIRSDCAMQCVKSPHTIPRIIDLSPKVHREKTNSMNLLRSESVSCKRRVEREVGKRTVNAMTALMPPALDVNLQRKHFTSRQRISETQTTVIHANKKENLEDPTWNKENQSQKDKELSMKELTSTIDNRPTKRFSFLVRNNNLLKEEEKISDECKQPKDNNSEDVDKISPSDKAILDRLSKLQLSQSHPNIQKPRSKTGSSQPPCGRCGEPVYSQELIKPTDSLYFHNSCFKCHQCGLRLNLLTFYRSPFQTKENRVFCRSHLPTTDGRPIYPDKQINCEKSEDIVKCDSVGLRYF